MKNWVLILVGGIAVYAAYKWYQNNKAGSTGTSANPFQNLFSNPGSATSPYNDVAGVPGFNQTAIVNRPDQVTAALHSNDASTLSGSFQYEPAFGPTTNQDGGVNIF